MVIMLSTRQGSGVEIDVLFCLGFGVLVVVLLCLERDAYWRELRRLILR
jgi:hypothetical protein